MCLLIYFFSRTKKRCCRKLADSTLDSDDLNCLRDENKNDEWITSLALSMVEKNILLSELWINDNIIRAAQLCLRKQYSGNSGLCNPLLVLALKVHCKEEVFAQVIYDGNSHWATVSNKACADGTVRYYDSVHSKPNTLVCKQIAALASYETKNITIERMNIYKQSGGNDCGIIALACVASLLYEQDPVNIRYIQDKMRGHLLSCLQQGKLLPFPVLAYYRSVRKEILSTHTMELHSKCCQIFTEGDTMIE